LKVGVQLYNLYRTPLNIMEKLKVISTLGYDGVELAGFNGMDYDGFSAKEIRTAIDEYGLEICGAHIMYRLFEESMSEIICFHKEAGIPWVAIPRPLVESKHDIDLLIGNINRYSGQLRQAGLNLYYHCHDFEFRDFEGTTAMQEILDATDIMIEVDVYWAAKGGADVAAFLRKHSDRILYIHLKDGNEEGSCAVGQGKLPCRSYYELAEAAGAEYVIVEDDMQKPDGITSICNSIQAIRKYE